MAIDKVIQTASRMYGISPLKSRSLVEQLLKENTQLTEGELLKLIGKKSLFYIAG